MAQENDLSILSMRFLRRETSLESLTEIDSQFSLRDSDGEADRLLETAWRLSILFMRFVANKLYITIEPKTLSILFVRFC